MASGELVGSPQLVRQRFPALAKQRLFLGVDREAKGVPARAPLVILAASANATLPARKSSSTSAGVPKTRARSSSNSPSQRATTIVARQLPIRFTQVRPMSMNSSTPKMTATPMGPRPAGRKLLKRREQNHERGARHGGHALGSDHQRQHDRDLLTETDVMSGGRLGRLRDEDGSEPPDKASSRRG